MVRSPCKLLGFALGGRKQDWLLQPAGQCTQRAAYDIVDLAIMGGHLELVDCEATGKRVNVDGKDCIIIALQTCFEAWYYPCHRS